VDAASFLSRNRYAWYALDSSVLPTFGAVDALTIVLAARHPELLGLLRYVQHGRLGLRGFSRLPAVASWNPPSTY
jgi:hypothetical protein